MVNNIWEGVSICYQKEESEGGKLLFDIVVLLENFLDAQTTHLLPSMLYFKLVSSFFFFVFFFSYVRDATAAMFVAFCLFVFPSQKPVIFTPDGSGKMG